MPAVERLMSKRSASRVFCHDYRQLSGVINYYPNCVMLMAVWLPHTHCLTLSLQRPSLFAPEIPNTDKATSDTTEQFTTQV